MDGTSTSDTHLLNNPSAHSNPPMAYHCQMFTIDPNIFPILLGPFSHQLLSCQNVHHGRILLGLDNNHKEVIIYQPIIH